MPRRKSVVREPFCSNSTSTCASQRRDQEVVAVQGVCEHHVAWLEHVRQAAPQARLAGALAAVRTDRRIQYRAGGQTDHDGHPRQRKAHAVGLRARLGVPRLVLVGVGHRDPRAVRELDRSASPGPFTAGPPVQLPTHLARQATDHPQRQPPACAAVPTRARASLLQSTGRALHRPTVDHLLARAIVTERLLHEHRQRYRRRIQPLPMGRAQAIHRLHHRRTGQHVEEFHRLDRASSPFDGLTVLMLPASGITIHVRACLGKRVGCVNTHAIDPWPALLIQRLGRDVSPAAAYVSAIRARQTRSVSGSGGRRDTVAVAVAFRPAPVHPPYPRLRTGQTSCARPPSRASETALPSGTG